ncbi:hypothetical protein FA13DRAFT_1877691 [Coprinellus micaceus]|uniref:TPR-like protein n=1 Tax=Coprinellus micaceus TaxID=71717 RepID=A0A4Y7S1H5_COPMI|nr:hypothetical protein FA13DRAFT_1877691 [Coprinellus micaceus]
MTVHGARGNTKPYTMGRVHAGRLYGRNKLVFRTVSTLPLSLVGPPHKTIDAPRYLTGRLLLMLAKSLHFKPDHLDEALQLSRESVSLVSPTNLDFEVLMTLATILLGHHEHSGAPGKLEEAISVCTEALSLCPLAPPQVPHPPGEVG